MTEWLTWQPLSLFLISPHYSSSLGSRLSIGWKRNDFLSQEPTLTVPSLFVCLHMVYKKRRKDRWWKVEEGERRKNRHDCCLLQVQQRLVYSSCCCNVAIDKQTNGEEGKVVLHVRRSMLRKDYFTLFVSGRERKAVKCEKIEVKMWSGKMEKEVHLLFVCMFVYNQRWEEEAGKDWIERFSSNCIADCHELFV